LISEALATLFITSILNKDTVHAFALTLALDFRDLLLPCLEIDACFGIGLLPSELLMVSIRAIRKSNNAAVLIYHLFVLLLCPVQVNTQW
jgi:hypothetical protein